jgi:Uma2 family endonuclease
MIEKGVLGPKDKVELIGGFIVNRSPQGTRHNHFLMNLNRLFAPLHEHFCILVQGAITVAPGQIYDPDFLVLEQKRGGYKFKHPEASNVKLVVEASESSLRFDQRVKLPVYAAAGVPEYWIADLEREVLIVHRVPDGDTYKVIATRQGDDSVSSLAAPNIKFAVRQAFE